jgi:hypothetical protein
MRELRLNPDLSTAASQEACADVALFLPFAGNKLRQTTANNDTRRKQKTDRN